MQLTSPQPSQTPWLARPKQPAVTDGPRRQPTFQGKGGSSLSIGSWLSNLPPNATDQFKRDLLGVWAPKIPLTRSKTQFFEDAFLENVENAAFYFAVPMAAPLFAKAINYVHGLELSNKQIGSSWSELPKSAAKDTKLLGAKMGAVLSVLSLAGGVEYMIQHWKNTITANQFETKNFAAVAGLEAGKSVAKDGEMDPVTKAKRRAWQVGSLMVGTFGLAAAMPLLVKNSKTVRNYSEKFLKYLHFGSDESKGSLFDLTKPMLALLAGIGAVSYMDAARDNLERKETGFRLLMVIPYMLFGKELAGNFLANRLENSKVDVPGEDGKTVSKTVKEIFDEYSHGRVKPSFLKDVDLKQQFWNPETFLNLNKVKGSISGELAEAVSEKGKKIPAAVQEAIYKKHGMIGVGSSLLSAAVCGIFINWLAYRQTQDRYAAEQAQKAQLKPQPLTLSPSTQVTSAFSGHPRVPQSSLPFTYPPYQQRPYGQPQWAPQGSHQPAGFSQWRG